MAHLAFELVAGLPSLHPAWRKPGVKFKTYRDLMLTMLLGGLWHGDNWTLMLWGGLHGCYLILQRLTSAPLTRLADTLRMPSPFRSIVGGCAYLHWLLWRGFPFEPPILPQPATFCSAFSVPPRLSLQDVPNKFQLYRDFFLILMVGLLEFSDVRFRFPQIFNANPVLRPVAGAALLLALPLFSVFGSHAFIYFQF